VAERVGAGGSDTCSLLTASGGHHLRRRDAIRSRLGRSNKAGDTDPNPVTDDVAAIIKTSAASRLATIAMSR
jgi:hypothetical protein